MFQATGKRTNALSTDTLFVHTLGAKVKLFFCLKKVPPELQAKFRCCDVPLKFDVEVGAMGRVVDQVSHRCVSSRPSVRSFQQIKWV